MVLDAESTSAISKAAGNALGGGAACFSEQPMAQWLRHHNPTDASYAQAVDRFMRSCAGYCVATCVLGVGDRHNSNIMVS